MCSVEKVRCIPTKQKSLAEILKTMYTVFVEEVCFMETIKNVLVGQSGGPTAVINASLAGVYETARGDGRRACIWYALWNTGTAPGADR